MPSEAPDWLALLRTATGRFADAVATAASGDRLEAPVAACPGWTVTDLTVHLGGVHRWAAHAVVAGSPDLEPAPPAPGADLAEWYADCAGHLLDVLTSTSADAPAWTLDREDRTAGFWRRRQVHETVMHTWDAEQALGGPQPIEPALAWDGVREVADVLYPRQVRLGRVARLPTPLLLTAVDATGRVTLGDTDDEEPIEVRERAEVLLRLLWHRADPTTEPVDPRAAELLSGALTP